MDIEIDYTCHFGAILHKVWREILEKYESWNGALYNTMKYYGVNSFTIRIVEEVQDNKLDERMVYWKERYSPEYNESVFLYKDRIRYIGESRIIFVIVTRRFRLQHNDRISIHFLT